MKLIYRVCSLLTVLLTLSLSGCAGLGSPGGGPEDKTPPVMLSVSPVSGSTGVDRDKEIVIVFSEPIDETSLISSLFVSPPQDKLKYRIRGRKLTIKPAGGLPVDQTLTVTIGSGVKDLHGNPLAASTTIAITSGEKIADGKIKGRVFGDPPLNGIIVGVWSVGDSSIVMPDSVVAPYLTQTSETGDFVFSFLQEGLYRILCWEDRNRNKLYQPGVDRLGVAPEDIFLAEDSTTVVNLYAAKRDTTNLAAVYLAAIDNRHIQLRLSKKLADDAGKWLSALEISDTLGAALISNYSWIDPGDSSRIIYLTDPQVSGMKYNASLPKDSIFFGFTGEALPDTFAPLIVASIPQKNAHVDFSVKGSIFFNDKISADTLEKTVILTIEDSLNSPIVVSQSFPNRLDWNTITPLGAGLRCLLTVNLERLIDAAGNTAGDTTWALFFKTNEPGLTGEISGQVVSNANYDIYVAAKPISKGKPEILSKAVSADGSFYLPFLAPGEYRIWCWEDRNQDNAFSVGNLSPFSFSERFAFAPDTVTVRARWETGGIYLKLP